MDIFYGHMSGQFQVHRRKVPDSFDPGKAQLICDFLSAFFSCTNDADIRFAGFDKINHGIIIKDRNAVQILSNHFGVDFENSFNCKPGAVTTDIVGNGMTQISCAYKYQPIFAFEAQNAADFAIQVFDVVPITLLAKATKIVQVLSDLRGCISDQLAELIGRNFVDTFFAVRLNTCGIWVVS